MGKRIGDLAVGLYGAPEWLQVESLTIEEDGKPPRSVSLDDLEDVRLPMGEFTLRVDVRPSSPRERLESL